MVRFITPLPPYLKDQLPDTRVHQGITQYYAGGFIDMADAGGFNVMANAVGSVPSLRLSGSNLSLNLLGFLYVLWCPLNCEIHASRLTGSIRWLLGVNDRVKVLCMAPWNRPSISKIKSFIFFT